MQPIPFHKTYRTGKEIDYVQEAVTQKSLVGDGPFSQRCEKVLSRELGSGSVLLTPSCTSALEISALLSAANPADPGEVIIPGFTFVSTALAFVMHGFRPVFVDIRESDCNVDPEKIREAITPRTRAIVPVHYAGVPCDMDAITAIADEHELLVIEDAAQAINSKYKGRPAGTIGQFGTMSFHDTKNVSCGEGGALIINDECYLERAERIREKGTNRSEFMRGRIHKYTWIDFGSSYLLSDLQAAFLLAQLEAANQIKELRRRRYERLIEMLAPLEADGCLKLPRIPRDCESNYHLFHILLNNQKSRNGLLSHLKAAGIGSAFHYLPLHLAPAGLEFGKGPGSLPIVESVAERLLRLPLYPTLTYDAIDKIVTSISAYFLSVSSASPRHDCGVETRALAASTTFE